MPPGKRRSAPGRMLWVIDTEVVPHGALLKEQNAQRGNIALTTGTLLHAPNDGRLTVGRSIIAVLRAFLQFGAPVVYQI